MNESSLRKQLKVPQNPKHHPEGPVDRHTMMVRSSLKSAINLLQEKQKADPDGPLSNLDLNFSKEDVNILRLAGLLHDIGKGDTLNPDTLTAYGHEDPENFEKAMQRLGTIWRNMYDNANPNDKNDLWWIIKYHMSLKDAEGFLNKALKRELLDQNGKYKPDRKVKLLLVLLLMDRMGRGGEPGIPWQQAKKFAQNNLDPARKGIEGMYKTALSKPKPIQTNAPIPNNPTEFITSMREKGKSNQIIKVALKNKFNLSDEEIINLLGESFSFKTFFESEEQKVHARLPLDNDVFTLAKIFKSNGHQIYVVGGAPRDFLKHYFSNPDMPFDESKTKDIDLTTDATPEQVKQMLTKAGVKNFGKGESFGVMVAHLNGEDYEIATFREDLGYSDGRRPDQVRWADMKTDHKRRDLTMNAIYYEIPASPNEDGTFIDPSGGQGFQDIKNWTVRMIGDPHERIGEDKLRIARIPRFHSYYNNQDITKVLDKKTLDAINQFKDMRSHGVTGPRIVQEFWSGLKKSSDTVSFLKNYQALGLLETVFPNLQIDINSVDKLSHIHHTKENKTDHAILVLAFLLRKNGSSSKVRSDLNKLQWPNEIVDNVAFLLKAWQTAQNPTPENMSQIAQEINKNPSRRNLLLYSLPLVENETNTDHLSHLTQYQPPTISGEEIQKELGLTKPGPQIGQEMKRRLASHYQQSFNQTQTK